MSQCNFVTFNRFIDLSQTILIEHPQNRYARKTVETSENANIEIWDKLLSRYGSISLYRSEQYLQAHVTVHEQTSCMNKVNKM